MGEENKKFREEKKEVKIITEMYYSKEGNTIYRYIRFEGENKFRKENTYLENLPFVVFGEDEVKRNFSLWPKLKTGLIKEINN